MLDKEEIYKSLVNMCLEHNVYFKDGEGRCLVIETAKQKKELEYYEKNRCGYECDSKCNIGKNVIG